jgi:hypothetical protein
MMKIELSHPQINLLLCAIGKFFPSGHLPLVPSLKSLLRFLIVQSTLDICVHLIVETIMLIFVLFCYLLDLDFLLLIDLFPHNFGN